MAGAVIETCVKMLTQVAGLTENIILAPSKKGIKAFSVSDGAVAEIKIPNLEIEGLSMAVEVATGTLLEASKGRDLNVSFSGHDLNLAKGSYKASIAASEAAGEPEFPTLEELTTEITLGDDAKAFLTQCLQATKIEKTFSGMQDILVYVKSTSTKVTIASFEAYQVAFIQTKNKVSFPDCEFVLPLSTLAKLTAFPGEVKLEATESMARMQSKALKYVTPLSVETINAIPKDAIVGLIKSTASSNGGKVMLELEKEKLDTFLNNSKSVVTTGSEVTLTGDAKQVLLTVSSGKGSVKEKFKGSCNGTINLDFRFLQALSAKSKDHIIIGRQDNFVLAVNNGVTYVAALSEGAG